MCVFNDACLPMSIRMRWQFSVAVAFAVGTRSRPSEGHLAAMFLHLAVFFVRAWAMLGSPCANRVFTFIQVCIYVKCARWLYLYEMQRCAYAEMRTRSDAERQITMAIHSK